MYVTPGIVVDNQLVTTDLVDINLNIRILLGSSYYDGWENSEIFVKQDPLGNPIDRNHPWNQTTIPRPQKRDFDDKYTWVMSPRWYYAGEPGDIKHLALDTGGGAIARLWSTALAGLVDIGYVKATGNSVKIYLPKTASLPEVEFEWKVPKWSNAIERDRARTYFQAYSAACALYFAEQAMAELHAGSEMIDRFGEDDLVASLLLLYGLHPLDVEARVLVALDKVRPYLRSHGGNVDLLGVQEGIVRLQLQGSCNGCASSAMTLNLAIEEAIYNAAPDIVALEVEGVVAQSTPFVQLQKSPTQESKPSAVTEGNGWEAVRGLTGLVEGEVQTIEISGRPILFCRVGENYYAYNDTCPECQQPLQTAALKLTALVCPSCKQSFDVMRAGRGLDKPGLYLEPFPLLIEQGQAKIALPVFR
jgi:Fe-S cluster biogenesis protein NfuA/nitrite reductase/ring-hydroxylating ferredoxin subunit